MNVPGPHPGSAGRGGLLARRAVVMLAGAVLLSGCAQTPRAAPTGERSWSGRLALRVEAEPVQTFFASFELSGDARRGYLLLTGPLGQAVARLAWNPDSATLETGSDIRSFPTIEALARQATGTAFPLATLFAWLDGQPAEAAGWQPDLTRLGEGRLTARRQAPPPGAELHLVLDAQDGPR